jgi:hypothetical protein
MKNVRMNYSIRARLLPTWARLLRSALLVMAALAVAGCSQAPTQPYAETYRAALDQIQGTSAITPAMTDRFVLFFSHESPEESPATGANGANRPAAIDPESMYGDPMYFSDTLLTTGNRSVALNHLRRMRDATGALTVSVIDIQVNGQDVYMVWQMQAVFEPVRKAVVSNSVGVTHLRFDDEGRIVLHQDFWDSAEGFYRHLPVVGRIINAIRGSFEHDER